MKLMAMISAVLMVSVGVAQSDTSLFPIPPYVCVGRILNYEALNAAEIDPTATISVYKMDENGARGALLARTTLNNYPNTLYNYRLEIPLSQAGSATTATNGEVLIPIITYAEETYSTENGLTIVTTGASGSVKEHDFTLVVDKNADGIDDTYAAIMQEMAKALGLSTADTYDAAADYDNDGKSNLEEYYAGTSALSAEDYFRIIAFGPAPDRPDFLQMTFVVSLAKSYDVSASEAIETADAWGKHAFRDAPSTDEPERWVHHVTAETPEVTKTIYVKKPEAGVPQFFYKVLAH